LDEDATFRLDDFRVSPALTAIDFFVDACLADAFLADDAAAVCLRPDGWRVFAPASVTANRQSRRVEQTKAVVRNPLFYPG
jgi:hypothetical protein